MPTKNIQVNIETHTFLLYLKKQSGKTIKRIISESLFLFANNLDENNSLRTNKNITPQKETQGN